MKVEWLTVDQVAERYHVPVVTVRLWRQKRYGPRGVRVGRRVLWSTTELERFDAELDEKVTESPMRI